MIPFCRKHRYTMVEDVRCEWFICPVGGEAVTHEQLADGDRTPHQWWPAGLFHPRWGRA